MPELNGWKPACYLRRSSMSRDCCECCPLLVDCEEADFERRFDFEEVFDD